MNWNNTQLDSRLPNTLESTQKIGDIIKYTPSHRKPQGMNLLQQGSVRIFFIFQFIRKFENKFHKKPANLCINSRLFIGMAGMLLI